MKLDKKNKEVEIVTKRKRNHKSQLNMRGVYKSANRFKAEINMHSESGRLYKYLGMYDTKEEAYKVREKYLLSLCGEKYINILELRSPIEEKMKEMSVKGTNEYDFCTLTGRLEAFQEVIELINQKLD